MVDRLYAYRIWIGIFFSIDGFAMMTYENKVSRGRSKALPMAVVGLNSLSIYVDLFMHHQGIIVILGLGESESVVTLKMFLINIKLSSGVGFGESSTILSLFAHHFNLTTSHCLGGVSETVHNRLHCTLISSRYQCHQFADLLGMEWLTLLCLSMIGFTDFVIASSLVYLLATSRTGFSRYGDIHSLLASSILKMNYLALIPS